MSKLRALSRNPYHGEIMIDAESLEVYSRAEAQGTPHAVLMKDEAPKFQHDLLDFCCENAYLSLPYVGLTPYIVTAVRRGYDGDSRSMKLKKSVRELTLVGNYLEPQAPYPSDYWIYHAEQPLCEENASFDRELSKPGQLHILNSYPLVPSGQIDESGMPHQPIYTSGINRFHNAEGLRCDIVVASNPSIIGLACQAHKVVYPIKFKSYLPYARRDPHNPWPSEEPPLNPDGIIDVALDTYKHDDGELLRYINAYGKSAEITHQQNYGKFEKAIQPIIEDADSGALKEKVKFKRLSA